VRQNPEILRAEKEIERTRGQVLEVRAQALPHVDLTGSYSQTDPNLLERSSGGNGASFQAMGPNGQTTNVNINNTQLNNSGGDKSWRIAIEARQLLYSGGQVRAALEIAKYTEDQSIYTMRETVDRIIAQTRNQFYLVLLNRQLIKVAEENIGLLADELKDQRNRFDAGTVPKFNVLRAEVALANAQPDLVRAKNAYLIAQLELAKTLGLAASRGPTAKPSFEVVGELRLSERNQNQAEAMATARELRPFLRAQRQSILIEEQQITVARAGYKPRLEATGGYEARNSRLSDDLGEVVNGWTFGVDGTWAVFDGFETKGKIQQAQARLAAAKITYEDSVRQVELEVQQALARLGEARELIVGQGKVVEQATEALRLARERLAAGAGTQLDVLDAQVELTKARTTQQQALYDYNTAAAEFDRATGTQTIYQEPGMPVRTVKSVKPVKVEPAPKKKGKK
jgi:outer membrane protein TolC